MFGSFKLARNRTSLSELVAVVPDIVLFGSFEPVRTATVLPQFGIISSRPSVSHKMI